LPVSGTLPLVADEDASLLNCARTAFGRDKPGRVGVAVSGGGDSMAALSLMCRVATDCGWRVFAVTVDHGLRPEAKKEAAFVGDFCASQSISHETVTWSGWNGRGNLQDRARQALYALIADWAVHNNVTHVVLGHTLNDRAETFLMRLARGAGLDGLAAMRKRWEDKGVVWCRAFISQSREELRTYLRRNRVGWLEDRSNEDSRFERVKARKVIGALKPLGITTRILGEAAIRLSDARHVLALQCSRVAREIVRESGGGLIFNRRVFLAQPREIRRRLLVAALRWISGAEYPPRGDSVLGLEAAIRERRGGTLSGCRMLCDDVEFRVFREARAVRDTVSRTDELWDGRWSLHGPHSPDLSVRRLGADGLRLCPDWRMLGLPRASLVSSPSVWCGGELAAAPLAGMNNGWIADLAFGRDDFSDFLMQD